MKTKLLLLLMCAAFAAPLFAEGPLPARKPERKTKNFYSLQPGRPPMPWAPSGVAAVTVTATVAILDDERHVYPTAPKR